MVKFAALIVVDQLPLQCVCSWCHTTMREGALPATHGICPPCVLRFEASALPVLDGVLVDDGAL